MFSLAWAEFPSALSGADPHIVWPGIVIKARPAGRPARTVGGALAVTVLGADRRRGRAAGVGARAAGALAGAAHPTSTYAKLALLLLALLALLALLVALLAGWVALLHVALHVGPGIFIVGIPTANVHFIVGRLVDTRLQRRNLYMA